MAGSELAALPREETSPTLGQLHLPEDLRPTQRKSAEEHGEGTLS